MTFFVAVMRLIDVTGFESRGEQQQSEVYLQPEQLTEATDKPRGKQAWQVNARQPEMRHQQIMLSFKYLPSLRKSPASFGSTIQERMSPRREFRRGRSSRSLHREHHRELEPAAGNQKGREKDVAIHRSELVELSQVRSKSK